MRHAEPKYIRDSESRYDGFGFVLVIAAAICAVTTAMYGMAIAFQGSVALTP
jgi:hypothetical protein